jgi:hypothetical protein
MRRHEEKNREKTRKKRKEEDERVKGIVESLNLEAFKSPARKEAEAEQTETEKKTRNRLPNGVDGYTAKLIKIRNRVVSFGKLLRAILKEKRGWADRDTKWIEKFSKLTNTLKIKDKDDMEELKRVKEEARKIGNGLARKINKNINKYKKKGWKKYMKDMEREGWENSKKFFDKILKKFKKRTSIRKVPKEYLKEGERNTDPEEIKKMIWKFWQDLYTDNKQAAENQYPEGEREWFKGEE